MNLPKEVLQIETAEYNWGPYCDSSCRPSGGVWKNDYTDHQGGKTNQYCYYDNVCSYEAENRGMSTWGNPCDKKAVNNREYVTMWKDTKPPKITKPATYEYDMKTKTCTKVTTVTFTGEPYRKQKEVVVKGKRIVEVAETDQEKARCCVAAQAA